MSRLRYSPRFGSLRRLALIALVTTCAALVASPGSALASTADPGGSASALNGFAAYCQRISSANGRTGGPYEATLTDLKLRSSCSFQMDDPWTLAAMPDELAQMNSATNGRAQAYQSVIYDTARKYQLPPAYLGAVMMAESRGDAFAVGDQGHSLGLFQLHDRGLGQSLGDRRFDPVLSAQIAAAALSEGWREGLHRGLAGDDLVGFAYGYKFNPGGDHTKSGMTLRTIYRRFTGGPTLQGDPPLDFTGILQDAAVFGASGSDYFVILFRPQDVPYSGPTSLAEIDPVNLKTAGGNQGVTAQNQGFRLPGAPMFSLGPSGSAVALLMLMGLAAGLVYRVRPAPVGGQGRPPQTSPTGPGSVLAMAMFKRKPNEKSREVPSASVTVAAPYSPPAQSTAGGSLAAYMEAPAVEVGSERIRILEEQIRDQRVLLEQAEKEFQRETAGLKAHLYSQAATLQAILDHLEQRLRPLQEYIAREESNLSNLVEDMTRRPEDFVAENFAGYIATQKASIDLTRKSIEDQRNPFIEYFEEQMEALELSLKRFDPFIERLASNLDEQQEILEGFLGAMRDDAFQAVRGYLDERADIWKQFASSGETEPTDTYRRLRHLRDGFARLAQGQQNLSDLLAHTARADDHIGNLVRPQGRTDVPIPMPIRDEARPVSDVSAEPEDALAE